MKMFNLSDLPKKERPSAIIDGLLFPNQISLLYAPSGTGKSALVVDMLVRASIGKVVAGQQTKPVDVFWLATESWDEHNVRLEAVVHQHNAMDEKINQHWVVNEQVVLVGDKGKNTVETLADILNEKKSGNDQIVVIDTLNQAMPGADENGSSGMSEVIYNIKTLLSRVSNLHVLIVHHSGKKKEYGPRGHSSLLCAVDTAMFISSLKQNLQLEVTKQRCCKTGLKIKFNLISLKTEMPDGTIQDTVGVEYI